MKKISTVILLFNVAIYVNSQSANTKKISEDSISWESPVDGGTPRDLSRVTRTGPYQYHIQAAFEEGGESVLKHAVSRADLICINYGNTSRLITVQIDLSNDGKRTEYDNKPESGMKLRDFIFIHSPGQSWQQVNGYTNGWIAVIQFEIVPGSTQVGLSPWYTYNDYLSFINLLGEGPFLKKRMIGKSDGNREHWELTITDTTVSKEKKRTIFWQAREHAYETFSSFAMEGLVPFLLSDKAAGFRKRYIITLHTMTNIDGVGNGYEYRAGYDFPEARKTQTGKLTFERMDSLHPDFAVAWHNWVAPRDRNVVFFTDGDNGVATTRAWLRFIQLFPSLRQWGHRWKDEEIPEKYNWQDKAPGGGNIHSYSHRTYGTNIWGWEMPWWNFTVDEVKKAGADFAFAFLTTLDEIKNNSVSVVQKEKPVRSQMYKVTEISINAKANVANPFKEAMLVGIFIAPSGNKRIVDGFYNGGDQWKIRFTPDEAGAWRYNLRGEGVNILQSGIIHCTQASKTDHGFINIHPHNPYAFAYTDTTAFFPMGDTNYGLYDDSPITKELQKAYIKKRRQQEFNFVRMEVGHSMKHARADNSYWAWGGTPEKPDLDSFNPIFFKGLDSLLQQMQNQKMNVELILCDYYRLPFTVVHDWTPARERLWIHYMLSRYSSYTNIFMWTISNEYETHPDGKYRLDTANDISWVKQTARYIKENDPYKHLITVHPVISSATTGNSPNSPSDLPWRIGGFFGTDSSLNVLSQQTGQTGLGVFWDEKCPCYQGDDPQLTASINADRIYRKPVINTENGYEYLKEQPTMRNQVHSTGKVRRSSWRIVCAGGYFAAGFSGSLGHSDIWNEIDPSHHYTFSLKDEGAGRQLKYLYRFFTTLPYWKMQPVKNIRGDAIAIAVDNQKTCVLYFAHGGRAKLEWNGTEKINVKWFNPLTGKFKVSETIKPLKTIEFTAPDKNDWVLLLNQDSQ